MAGLLRGITGGGVVIGLENNIHYWIGRLQGANELIDRYARKNKDLFEIAKVGRDEAIAQIERLAEADAVIVTDSEVQPESVQSVTPAADKLYRDHYGTYGLFTDEEETELRTLFNDPKNWRREIVEDAIREDESHG